jgi:glyoxylase-like metal-dependent hydrolase (beta-lactamase superfamily II)
MRRSYTLSAITAVAAAAVAVGAAGQQVPSAPLQVEKITDKVFALRGGGPVMRAGNFTAPVSGTTIAFITKTGVILVDTKIPQAGQELIQALKTITDLPVTTIINTHFHEDHTGGNPAFSASIDVIAHRNTAELMRTMPPPYGGVPQPNIFAASGGRGLPTRTFDERMTLTQDGERVELYYFGRAHTGGDAWVVFPSERVLHAGDVFALKTYPIIDTNNGGSSAEYSQTIQRASMALANIETIITGHSGSRSTIADLRTYGEFVREWVDAIREAKNSGVSPSEFIARWRMPERYLQQGYLPIPPFVDAIWNDTP